MRRVRTRIRPQTATAVPAAERRAFYEALQELLRIYQFRDRDRACYGSISPNECHALEAVELAGDLSVNGLATALGLHKSNASRLADGLVSRGLLARRADAADRRGVRLALTASGDAAHAQIRARIEGIHATLLGKYSGTERARFIDLLHELADEAAERVGKRAGCSTIVSPTTAIPSKEKKR
jgi:MarR family transcriptional regulator, 2-MHQ and catechol-resistance regulon repressor